MEPIDDLEFDPLFEWAFSEMPNRDELDEQLEANEDVIPPRLADSE